MPRKGEHWKTILLKGEDYADLVAAAQWAKTHRGFWSGANSVLQFCQDSHLYRECLAEVHKERANPHQQNGQAKKTKR